MLYIIGIFLLCSVSLHAGDDSSQKSFFPTKGTYGIVDERSNDLYAAFQSKPGRSLIHDDSGQLGSVSPIKGGTPTTSPTKPKAESKRCFVEIVNTPISNARKKLDFDSSKKSNSSTRLRDIEQAYEFVKNAEILALHRGNLLDKQIFSEASAELENMLYNNDMYAKKSVKNTIKELSTCAKSAIARMQQQ